MYIARNMPEEMPGHSFYCDLADHKRDTHLPMPHQSSNPDDSPFGVNRGFGFGKIVVYRATGIWHDYTLLHARLGALCWLIERGLAHAQ